ncbi:Protein of unknown function [Propionibacterium freudenreichii]|nr:Protein of unknown function [Propionibacterium freudenreichii subsp. freudenreichii]CEG86363.1 Protein of unknown function [Propionibacterium freudenreichii]CEG87594.1 Protein of unknown function [Propionibacterium freudenreichii]CEG91413.1 Protein of unknown function [Propionibacterium freudenreichii]CEG93621.1 Protein of unknown function [Propionibacterium freudenreichii]
MSRVFL